MKTFGSDNLCAHGGDVLAYLYEEMASADRESFELHLADCGTCIDDFADLSQSRYPVYEWKQLEFAPMPTPRVVVPLGIPNVSLIDRVRAAFSLHPALGFGGAFAAMLVFVATAYLLLSGRPAGVDIAEVVEPSTSPVATVSTVNATIEPDVKQAVDVEEEPMEEVATPVKAVARVRTPERQIRPTRAKRTPPAKPNEEIPVMSSIDDDEDDSLRLADIFDEIGTSD